MNNHLVVTLFLYIPVLDHLVDSSSKKLHSLNYQPLQRRSCTRTSAITWNSSSNWTAQNFSSMCVLAGCATTRARWQQRRSDLSSLSWILLSPSTSPQFQNKWRRSWQSSLATWRVLQPKMRRCQPSRSPRPRSLALLIPIHWCWVSHCRHIACWASSAEVSWLWGADDRWSPMLRGKQLQILASNWPSWEETPQWLPGFVGWCFLFLIV